MSDYYYYLFYNAFYTFWYHYQEKVYRGFSKAAKIVLRKRTRQLHCAVTCINKQSKNHARIFKNSHLEDNIISNRNEGLCITG